MLGLAMSLSGVRFEGRAADAWTVGDPAIRSAWYYGREYYVLRSGRAQLIVQADRADLGPAVRWLAFDAQDARQSARKERAFNWGPDDPAQSSALEVRLGGFGFTALGHRTDCRWTEIASGVPGAGVPAFEARWWAGGVRVVERLFPLLHRGWFVREIELAGAHLAGPEAVTLILRVPQGRIAAFERGLASEVRGARLGVWAPGSTPIRAEPDRGNLELGPIGVEPGGRVRLTTILTVAIPGDGPAEPMPPLTSDGSIQATAEWRDTETYWQRTSRMVTADGTVQGIFDRARFGLPGMIADDGTMDAGIFEYGAQWVRDTSNTALGAIHAGHFEAAQAALERMLTRMVNREGVTMIANAFESPDLEQFDQMGELIHVLKAWRDWTGDERLLREHRELLLALIERPLRPEFRDATGMVHNRREFWERTFTDAYELAYQTYVILGLRDAADLAGPLGAEDRVGRWRAEADRILDAVLRHPTRALVDGGHLIKRRLVSGRIANDPAGFKGFAPDVPLNAERANRLMPDASQALPIALGVVDPKSPVARGTLDQLEGLWNTRWSDGGYDRYHTSGQPDQPGPWPFATMFILRAQHEAGLWDRSRRSLEWMARSAGGSSGTWFEEIPSVRSQLPTAGLVPWTSGEVTLFVVRHYLGVRFEGDTLVIRPRIYPDSPPLSVDLRFRDGRLQLAIDGRGRLTRAVFQGEDLRVSRDGRVNWRRE